MADVLVVNASPLVFLGNAGRLELLRTLGSARILIPEVVFREIVDSRHQDRASAAVAGASWIERIGPTPVPSRVVEWDLDAGEMAVVALALATPGAAAVLDDLAGRKCALSVGLDVMGTLGVVIAAYRKGEVADPRQVIAELRTAGMWLSDHVITRALRIAGVEA